MRKLFNKNTIYLLVLILVTTTTALLFVFPAYSVSSGMKNDGNANRMRMTDVFCLTNGNVFSISFENSEQTELNGISFYLRISSNSYDFMKYGFPQESKLVYSIFNGDEYVATYYTALSEIVLVNNSAGAMRTDFYFDGSSINVGDEVTVVFVMEDVPEDMFVYISGYYFDEDESYEDLVINHPGLRSKAVPMFQLLVAGKDYSLALVLLVVIIILFERVMLDLFGGRDEQKKV